ncbi:hypothetical protein ACFFJ4_05710 [Xanthomonas dyei]|uniref:hypothetical protein n=1 Tax=Xanthomonas dyei TaxID=743699 RepID=UPI0011B0AB55|nr:hypothetical protein [Xanthomonas dyei]
MDPSLAILQGFRPALLRGRWITQWHARKRQSSSHMSTLRRTVTMAAPRWHVIAQRLPGTSCVRIPPSAIHKHPAFEHSPPSKISMAHLMPSGRIYQRLDTSPARCQARQSPQDVGLWLCAAAITASAPIVRFTRDTAGCSQVPRP